MLYIIERDTGNICGRGGVAKFMYFEVQYSTTELFYTHIIGQTHPVLGTSTSSWDTPPFEPRLLDIETTNILKCHVPELQVNTSPIR